MRHSTVIEQVIEFMTGVRLDVRRAGKGLIAYAALLLVSSIPVVLTGSPAGLVAIAVCLGYTASGLGLARRYAWTQHLFVLSCTVHVGLAVGWFAGLAGF